MAALSLIFAVTILAGFSHPSSSSDYTGLIYKGCAAQKFQAPTGAYSENLKSLLSALVSQSSTKTYSSATAGEAGEAVSGLFQCRGDLSSSQCGACVAKIPEMSGRLCAGAIAARVQLGGCYLRYEVAGFKPVPDAELLYKVCGSRREGGAGFAERRDAALGMLETEVGSGGLFYTGSLENVYVLGQCEGGFGSGECGECVEAAVQTAKSGCGDAISGQIYLQKCYISYSYYPNGVPTSPSSSSSSGAVVLGHNTQKTVAVVVGGVAALGFCIVCLLFMRSIFKKRKPVFEY